MTPSAKAAIPKITYYYFDNLAICDINNPFAGNCYQFNTPTTVYSQSSDRPSDCSSCVGSLNCGKFGYIDSGCIDLVGYVCERPPLSWACNNKAGKSCSSINNQIDCERTSKNGNEDLGCSWEVKQTVSSISRTAYASKTSCHYNSNLCPSCSMNERCKLNPNTHECVKPACATDAFCESNYGPGFYCENPSEYNAKCVPDSSYPFSATIYKTLDDIKYKFSTRYDVNKNPWLDIYAENNLIYYGLRPDQQFILGSKGYLSIFTLPSSFSGYSFSLYSSQLVNRLTYNIFPVCGNGVCETCESEDNCLSYPPESCFSCPQDCPQVSLSEVYAYNEKSGGNPVSLNDALTDPNTACKVSSMYSHSSCNPLCLTHKYVDNLGCIFNMYSNAMPEDEYSNNNLLPKSVINNEGGVVGYYGGIVAVSADKELSSFKVSTINNDKMDGFIAGAPLNLSKGEKFVYGATIWVPLGKSISIRIREAIGGGWQEGTEIIVEGNNNWQYVEKTFIAGENAASQIEGVQSTGTVADTFSFYVTNLSLKRLLAFKDEDSEVFFSNKGEFYGANNSYCIDSCECISGNCDGNHCCEPGYSWSYTDPKNKYCNNGRIKEEYRKDFSDYDERGIIKSTIKIELSDAHRYYNNGGINANEFICLDNPNVSVSASNKTSCYLNNYDPYCVYGDANIAGSYSVIKQDNIGQCRKPEPQTPQVLTDLKCTIHTHTFAKSTCDEPNAGWWGCKGDFFGNTPYANYFCVTDNAFECPSYYSLREYKDNQEVIMTTISYYDFCTTKELVCAGKKIINNDVKGGSMFFTNCPQNGYDNNGGILESSYISRINMPVGYYCSLFGNDYDIIFGVNAGDSYNSNNKVADAPGTYSYNKKKYSPITTLKGSTAYSLIPYDSESYEEVNLGELGYEIGDTVYIQHPHLPIIERDSNERLYHLLWNYESCKKVYGDLTPTCDNNDINSKVYMTKDSADTGVTSYPTFHFLGNYNYPTLSDDDKNYVVSQEFCRALWNATEWGTSIYNWKTSSPIPNSLTLIFENGNTKTINSNQTKKYIDVSCIYWYTPWLDAYYNESVPASETGVIITPPTIQWGAQITTNYPCMTEGCVPTSSTEYIPLDINYFKSQSYCVNGAIMAGQKCMQNYPWALIPGYNVDNKPGSGTEDWPRIDTCNCTYNSETGYPYGCI